MDKFKLSSEFLERALRVIPLGSQTFSKSITQYPKGISPLFIKEGKGSKVIDIDNNTLTDFVSSLGTISLGYSFNPVNKEIIKHLNKGTIFSLPSVHETVLAEIITQRYPCAELVRFGKNGSDVTQAAVRLARAYTGKDHILVCGYHGWHDWYIGSTSKNLGVPVAVRELTHSFNYNDIDGLAELFKKQKNKVAAVIMEPMNSEWPQNDFLQEVRNITEDNNSLLIFDEMYTCTRYSLGGAQEYFGVTPDLCTLGKGIANGMPLSVITGKSTYMKLMEDIFFSGTFGGEILSIIASIEVLKYIDEYKVCDHLESIGKYLSEKLNEIIVSESLEEVISISGHPSWSFFNINYSGTNTFAEIKTFIMQELLERDILMIGTHNLSYSHSKEDIDNLLQKILGNSQPSQNTHQ